MLEKNTMSGSSLSNRELHFLHVILSEPPGPHE